MQERIWFAQVEFRRGVRASVRGGGAQARPAGRVGVCHPGGQAVRKITAEGEVLGNTRVRGQAKGVTLKGSWDRAVRGRG